MLAGLEILHMKWGALGFVDGPGYKAVVPYEGFELGRYGPVVNFRTEAKLLAPGCPLRGIDTPLGVGEICHCFVGHLFPTRCGGVSPLAIYHLG